MPSAQHTPPSEGRPRRLLTQNREMRAIGVHNWTLPAWAGRLPDGRSYNTCPAAGICRHVCYARFGTYTWPAVRAKHQSNMRARPDTNFYAYTKEIRRFKAEVETDPPDNFLWVYSYGGTQDALLDPGVDRVADVFPGEDAIREAGWSSQEATDLLAVLGPHLVGVPANNIPHLLKRLAGRRFSEWQADVDAHRRTRNDAAVRSITSAPSARRDTGPESGQHAA